MAKEEQQEWIRLDDFEIPGCRVFVTPTSYTLMTDDDRERQWAQDVATQSGPAAMWIAACAAVEHAKIRELRESKSKRPQQRRKVVGG
ncbi:hypothetical protein [Alicyclobacillus acidiphilus]|uniref:hypothetical protein n=1 Tax=Alicyclobacillus acidiphilus TaxID=182455 RepID=UPI00082CD7BC|nr:hypothetical protein [Alicyclobacillus acidiphilus]